MQRKSIAELDELSITDCQSQNDWLLLGSENSIPKKISITDFVSKSSIARKPFYSTDSFEVNIAQKQNDQIISKTITQSNLLSQYSVFDCVIDFTVLLNSSEVLSTDDSQEFLRCLPRFHLIKRINQTTAYSMNFEGLSGIDIPSTNFVNLTQLYLNKQFYTISCTLSVSQDSITFASISYQTSDNRNIDFNLSTKVNISISAQI